MSKIWRCWWIKLIACALLWTVTMDSTPLTEKWCNWSELPHRFSPSKINKFYCIYLFFLQLFRHTADTDYSYSLVKVYKCSWPDQKLWSQVKTMSEFMVYGGSTGSWTRSSEDMTEVIVLVVREKEEGKGGCWAVSRPPLAPPTQSFLIRLYTLVALRLCVCGRRGGGCHRWPGDAMPPWDTDGRRGQRGRWRKGRQQSTKWRRRRGPGKARGWKQSAGLPGPLRAELLMLGLLFLSP